MLILYLFVHVKETLKSSPLVTFLEIPCLATAPFG